MTNTERYIKVFVETFEVEDNAVRALQYQGVQSWDSIGHMILINALESEFEIILDPDDIVELSSFEVGIKILTKYNINF